MIAITKLLHLKSINAVKWQKTSKQKFKKKRRNKNIPNETFMYYIYIRYLNNESINR